MRTAIVSVVAMVAMAGMVVAGCAPAAPPPAPTAAPPAAPKAAPTAAAPAKAPAAPTAAPAKATAAPPSAPQPTAAPAAKKVDFPEKGRAITFLVTSSPGGGADIGARLRAPLMEKDLGVPFEVVNKPGAATQVGLAEFVRAKPDGHTIATFHLPTSVVTYLDAARKAPYTRKDFEPIVLDVMDPVAIAVRADSRFKTAKDLVDAAKAEPEKITVSAIGPLSDTHLGIVLLEKAAGVKFAVVQTQGWAEAQPALLGGHVMASSQTAGNFLAGVKSGQLRVLGIMDKEDSKLFPPEVKTFKAQGYDVSFPSSRGYVAPAGIPKEVIQILDRSIKKTMDNPEVQKKMDDLGFPQRYMGPAEFGAYWAEMEALTKELMERAK